MVKLEGDINRGVAFYKKALYYNWHYADAMYNLGVAYGDMLKFDMAIALLCQSNPTQSLNNLGVVYTVQGKTDAAASMIEKAIIANPTYAEAYTNLVTENVLWPSDLRSFGKNVSRLEANAKFKNFLRGHLSSCVL
ncbi:hypothetical protein OROMI_028831 [Orobanche minor]